MKNPFFSPCFVISTVIAPTGRAIENPTTINVRNVCNRLELPLNKLYKNSPFRLIIHNRRKGSMIISDLIEMREIDDV